MLLLVLGYGAIPLWAPIAVSLLAKPLGWQELELEVGYPSHTGWHIKQLSWRYTDNNLSYRAALSDVSLGYTWQTLEAQQWPLLTIAQAQLAIEPKTNMPIQLPSIALVPSQWLNLWPQFTVAKFALTLPNQGQKLELSGQLKHQSEALSLLARISVSGHENVYLDAVLGHNDTIEAKLFSQQDASPVAKITSSIRRKSGTYSWQGQAAINLPFSQKAFAQWWPPLLAELNISQGRLTSHWLINLPLDAYESSRFTYAIAAAQGEFQSQVQLEASSPLAKSLSLDTSFTQTFAPNVPPKWRLNEGSQLRIVPNWDNSKIDPNLYQSLLLEQAQLTFIADSPLDIQLSSQSGLLGARPQLKLVGNINATLENTNSVYQVFGQLSQLEMQSLKNLQGTVNLSGYYLAQAGENPWMAQLPIGLHQLQFLSEVDFNLDPKQWQFTVYPSTKVSATQVESRRQAGSMQLFASDKLNLNTEQVIELTYQPSQDYWTWSNIALQLKPESIPSQGLDIAISKGSSLITNRPLEGQFKLQPTLINLPGWPSFQAQSEGDFSWLEGQLRVDFDTELPPYIASIKGQYTWQADAAQHQLLAQSQAIKLALLLPQLKNITSLQPIPLPLLAKVTGGLVDYQGDWRWHQDQVTALQRLNYEHIDAQYQAIKISGLSGQSQFNYDNQATTNNTLTGQHSVKASTVSWGSNQGFKLQGPRLELDSSGWADMDYAINKLDAQWLGGRVLINNASIKPKQLNDIAIELQNIQLNQLIGLAQTPPLSATGKVSGSLNLSLDRRLQANNSWQLTKASLASSQMGSLTLAPNKDTELTEATEATEAIENSAYLHAILSQFNYENLAAELFHDGAGELTLVTQLTGSNPNFKNGHALDFSLTLNPQLRSTID